MRIIPIIAAGLYWFLLNVSIVGEAANSKVETNKKSDLLLIADDFRILSRVTNALALHSAAVENKLQLEDVLAEVFGIDKVRFSKIINVDVASAREEMNRLIEPILEIYNLTGSGPDEQLLQKHFLNFYKTLSSQLDLMKSLSEIPLEGFLEQAGEVANWSDFACILPDYEALNNFNHLFGKHTALYEFNDTEKEHILKNFETQSLSALNCLKNLATLDRHLVDQKLLDTYKDHEDVVAIGRTVIAFETVVKKRTKSVLTIRAGIIAGGLKNASDVWDEFLLSNRDMQSVMWNLSESVSETIFHIRGDSANSHLTVTAGFRKPEDMKLVFDDLKSSWFNNNIAKHASTEKLAKSLVLFDQFSNRVLSMISSWTAWTESSKGLITQNVTDRLQFIKRLKHFSTKSEYIVTAIKLFHAEFPKCYNAMETNGIEDFKKLMSQQRPAVKVAEQLKKVRTLVSKVLPLRRGASLENFIHIRNNLIKHIGRYQGKNLWTSIGSVEVQLKPLGEKVDQFFDMIEQVGILSEALTELKNLSASISPFNGTLTSLKMILNNTKFLEVAQCVRKFDTHLDATIEGFAVHDILTNIQTQSGQTATDNINKLLANLLKFQGDVKNMTRSILKAYRETKKEGAILLALKNSKQLSAQLGQSIKFLEDLDTINQNRVTFGHKMNFPEEVERVILENGLEKWTSPEIAINRLLNEIDELNEDAKSIRHTNLTEMTELFEKAADVEGIQGTQEKLNRVYNIFKDTDNRDIADLFKAARELDMDFAKRSTHLKNIKVTVSSLQDYFDEIFGHKKKDVTIVHALAWWLILCLCLGLVMIMMGGFLGVFALTENGRAWYKNTYLYYFGTAEDFEKRWRYSSFMDTNDGKNSLLDAVREGNLTSLLKALKNGAYVDVYNKFGNTSLHVATKFAQPDHVELLIKYGADRSLLNYKNCTPLQYIPHDYQKRFPEKAEKYDKIQKIFKKYEKKSFRSSVPRAFPVTSFHIWPDDSADDKLCNRFMDQFRSITSDEAMPTTTHCVVKVDSQGILETDRLDLLLWLFHGVIMVKEQWMTDCLVNEKLIEKDCDYLVEKVRFNGVVFPTILAWSEAMAKGEMPFLLGAYVAVVAKDYKNLNVLSAIVTTQGGTMMNQFPLKEHYALNSHPYLHANLGPLFLIHDGTQDLKIFKNDPDKMYTLFTEEEFVAFLLRREMHKDDREHPPPVVLGDE